MKSITLTKEGYWGIPKTEKIFTEDELITLANTKDQNLIPALIATVKKAQDAISITAVTIKDENGDAPTTVTGDSTTYEYEMAVGATKTLTASHTPAESTKDTTWTNNSSTYLEVVVDKDDPRVAYVTHKASGTGTVTATVGSTSYVVTITNPS